jgi:hypothetical protein
MIIARRFFPLLPLLLAACNSASEREPVDVAVSAAALSACDETVPANRNVDGIPAYAQCTASENSAIYSNNGIDTSLTSMGSDWVRTQGSGGYQCTEFAHRYWYFKWNVKWTPNGNAGTWCDTMPPSTSGVVQTTTSVHGDVMVLANGSCGASSTTGHVNVVDVVDPSGAKLTAVEQNGARRGSYMMSCAKCFLHIVANNGAATGAPGTAAGASGAPAAPPPPAAGAPASSRRASSAGSPALAPPPPAVPASAPTPVPGPSPASAGASAALPAIALAGASAASAGRFAGAPVPPQSRTAPAANSCSVARVGAARHRSPCAAAALALALIFLRLGRRQRARAA